MNEILRLLSVVCRNNRERSTWKVVPRLWLHRLKKTTKNLCIGGLEMKQPPYNYWSRILSVNDHIFIGLTPLDFLLQRYKYMGFIGIPHTLLAHKEGDVCLMHSG
jgi:hypothetical protein